MSIQRRLYDCATIGGPYIDAGLGHTHADAHYGLIHSTLGDLLTFAANIPDGRRLPLVSLIPMIIEREGDTLADRAAVMQWSKRKAEYDTDYATWKAAEPDKSVNWRKLPMTASQRYLIADTARILEVEIPEGMDRGAASDWLEANGAHVINRIGSELS